MAERIISGSIPEALKNYDQSPDTASFGQPVVQGLFTFSPASIWRGVKVGRIPKPHKLSPITTCWNVGGPRAILAATGK